MVLQMSSNICVEPPLSIKKNKTKSKPGVGSTPKSVLKQKTRALGEKNEELSCHLYLTLSSLASSEDKRSRMITGRR